MTIILAILFRLINRSLFASLATVPCVFSGDMVRNRPTSPTVISMTPTCPRRDATIPSAISPILYKHRPAISNSTVLEQLIPFALLYPFRFYHTLLKMADNLRRAVQDINLGVDDVPVALSAAVVAQAAAENRFILMGRPVMPRRQNLRSIVASMPRVWGQAGLVHGRIVPENQFQFIFPSEESLETVIRRGPWAFNDRMLLLQRWTPLENPPLLNFINFWIQIRGIPFHFLSREVIGEIGRAIGNVLDIDFDAEAAARVEFVRVQISWDVDQPLRFQRYFQFQAGVNTLLRFRYERLHGFCEVCGMLTHDSGACLILNGGPDSNSEGDDDDDMPNADPPNQNQGVVIRKLQRMRRMGDLVCSQ
ncbi:hypothetical protein AtEden1_Chr3g0191721 [Arabidopsis thaliana]